MNRFKDKTFIGFYFKYPFYFYSIAKISPNHTIDFIAHQKQIKLSLSLSKQGLLYGAIPMAEVDFFKQNSAVPLTQNTYVVSNIFYLGYEQGHEVFLMAKVSDVYFQEQAIRLGKDIVSKCHYEVDILALWHLIYWYCLEHNYLDLSIIWIYALEQGFYLLLGKAENLWAYCYVRSLSEIKSWLSESLWPYPSFYCVLNKSLDVLMPEIIPLFINGFKEWTLSAALAIRGVYAAI